MDESLVTGNGTLVNLKVEGKLGPKASKYPTHSQVHLLLFQNPFFEYSKLTFLFSTLLSFIFVFQEEKFWGFILYKEKRENYTIHHNLNSIILFLKIFNIWSQRLIKMDYIPFFFKNNQALYFRFKCPLTVLGLKQNIKTIEWRRFALAFGTFAYMN